MAATKTYNGYIYEQQADGSWRKAGPAGPQMPADPTFPLQAPKVRADIASTQANAQGQAIDNRVAGATVGAQITKAEAEAIAAQRAAQTAGLGEGQQWGPDGKTVMPIPGYTRQGLSPEVRAQAIQGYSDADELERIAADLEAQFNAGPGKTHGIRGLADYFPTAQNQKFDDTSFQARGYVKRGLGFTGGEGNTIGEIGLNYGPYLPEAGDRDARITGKIEALRNLAAASRKKAVALLGGVPDANGNVRPIQDDRPNAMTMERVASGDSLQAAAFGATQGITEQYPPEMVQAHQQLVMQLLAQGGGKLDPQAYAQARSQLNQQFGFSGDPQADITWASGINDFLAKGGKTVPGDITPAERDLTTTEAIRNSMANNAPVAAGINYADMAGFGGISLLDRLTGGNRMDALNEANPVASTVGQIGGAITGAGLTGKIGGFALGGAITPRMAALGRLKLGQGGVKFGKEMATDALYSGVVGANQGSDPLESALWGAGGSLAGRGVGSVAGKAIEGANLSAPVQYLRSRNIPLTVGQALGGFAKSAEDAATSLPLVGDMIGRRYKDSLRGLSHAAAEDVGGPIGYKPPANRYGRELTDDMGGAMSDYYTNTVQGANAPLDGQYAADMAGVVGRGQSLPPDLQVNLGKALDNSTAPINNMGSMTGEAYQKAMMRLKSYKGQYKGGGFEGDYRDALSGAQDALKGNMVRGGGQDVVQGLTKADEAYRLFKPFEKAVYAADGAGYLPTASQLQDAIKAAGKKYPGKNPMLDLADAAQDVLPSKLPDSGTGRRLIQYGLGAAAIGGAQAADSYAGTDIVNPYTMGALALLTAGGTKHGQKLAVKTLADRPDVLRKAGRKVSKNKGLFGRAVIPFTLEQD